MEPTFGLVVLEERAVRSSLSTSGGRASVFSEAGPVPGHPTPAADVRVNPFISGAQDQTLVVRGVRPGFPGRDGYSVALGLEGGAEADLLGWEDPVVVRYLIRPEGTDVDPLWNFATGFTAVAGEPGREALHVFSSSTSPATANARTWVWDSRREAWSSAGVDWSVDLSGGSHPIALAWDPDNERLLAFHGPGIAGGGTIEERGWTAYRANADASAFEIYSRGIIDRDELSPTDYPSGSRLHVVPAKGADWLMIYADNVGGANFNSRQLVSSDQGATWQSVKATPADLTGGSKHFPTSTAGGGFIVAYVDSDDNPAVRVLGSARTDFDSASPIVVDDDAARRTDSVAIATDADGLVYLLARDDTDSHRWRLYRSVTSGATWQRYEELVLRADSASVSFTIQDAAFVGGSLYCALAWSGAGLAAGGASVLVLGGFTSVESDGGYVNVGRRWRQGFGDLDIFIGNENLTGTFLGVDDPDLQGWTTTSSGTPTETADTSTGDWGWQVIGSSTDRAGYATAAGAGAPPFSRVQSIAQATLIYNSADASASPAEVTAGLRLRAVDDAITPTTGYDVAILLHSDVLRVYDIHAGAVVVDHAWTPPSGPLQIRAHVRPARVSVWWRTVGDDAWTEVALDDALTANVATTAGTADFGCFAVSGLSNAAADVTWRDVHFATGQFGNALDDETEVFDAPSDGTRGLAYGRPVTAVGTPYPVPLATTGGTAASRAEHGYLQARGGPGLYDQQITLPVAHTYALDNALPEDSPSPRVQWRTTGTATQQEVVFDWGASAERWSGNVIALVIMNAAPRQWVLETDDGGAGWTTLGTVDLALGTGLTFARTGRHVRPASGTTAVDRYIHEGELSRGGWFSDGTTAQRIVRNSGGFWTDRAGVQQVEIELDDAGSIAASGSSAELVAGSGVGVFLVPTAAQVRRYMRVRVAASQVVPDGDYRAGIVAFGRVVGVGADPAWGWSRQVELSRELARRTDQFLEVRPTGPARTVLTYGWPDGVVLRELNSEATAGEVAYPTSDPLGTEEDAHSVVTGLLVERLDQGRVPVVVIPRLPALGTTLTDPHRWLYGRVRTDSHGIVGVVGTEGEDEVVRVDSITVEELR